MDKKFIIFVFIFLISCAYAQETTSFSNTPSETFSQSTSAGSSFSGGYSSSFGLSNVQYSKPNFNTYYGSDMYTYWPILGNQSICQARQDMLLQVAPAGCQPTVVRSDLLEEQNVPVFCQVDALQVNPLIDVQRIERISFSGGNYGPYISTVAYHPARAALRTRDRLIGNPLINNIGYVVVVLKKTEKEKDMPEWVNITLTGDIEYSAANAIGIGKSVFILKETTDDEWKVERFRQSFWQGRYFLRLEEANAEAGVFSIYKGDNRVSTVRVRLGQESSEIYLPGYYCNAGLKVAYDKFEAAEDSARIEVSDNQGTNTFDVYKGSSFLDDRCSVIDLKVTAIDYGSITLSCGSERFMLSLNANPNSLYAKYQSMKESTTETITVNGKPVSVNVKTIDGVKTALVNEGIFQFKNNKWEEVEPAPVGKDGKPVNVKDDERRTLIDKKWGKIGDVEIDTTVDDAIESYKKVALEYPAEKKVQDKSQITFGEEALLKALKLSVDFSKDRTSAEILSLLITTYPQSESIQTYQMDLNKLYRVDSSLSGYPINLDNVYRTIRVTNFRPVGKKPTAFFSVGTKSISVALGSEQEIDIGTVGPNQQKKIKIKLERMELGRASINVICSDGKGSGIRTLVVEQSENICDTLIKFEKEESEKVVRARLTPMGNNIRTKTNISVNIGIEKRAIELNPDKTLLRIQSLNDTIKQWEKISESLGKVVKGMKAACFATAGVLTLKNFATGLSGEALARQKAMRGADGWTNKCKDMIVPKGPYATLDECYLREADNIEKDVKAYESSYNKVNEKIKQIEEGAKNPGGGLLGDTSIDGEKAKKELAQYVRGSYGEESVTMPAGKEWMKYDPVTGAKTGSISTVYVKDVLAEGNLNSMTYAEVRDLYMNLETKRSGSLSETGAKGVGSSIGESVDAINVKRGIDNSAKEAEGLRKQGFAAPLHLSAQGQTERLAAVVPLSEKTKSYFTGGKVTHTSTVVVTPTSPTVKTIVNADKTTTTQTTGGSYSGTYLLGLSENPNTKGTFIVEEVVKVEGGVVKDRPDKGLFSKEYNIGTIKSVDQMTYNNLYINPEVKFYETEPYKGMPAVVPFAPKTGWYAATRQTLPIFGGIGAYDSSGRVVSFWVCNVGANGREQFEESGFGDDQCRQVNLNTGQSVSFPGLDESTSKRLVDDAVEALQQAAQQSKSSYVEIRTTTGGNNRFKVGKPAVTTPSTQCQDFMSAKDCNLLFNVCDPVICPASRCNLGGKYPVSDVIQTGIVGSALLCLPNFREGIYIPVCLTGIQAGIDSYVSILKNHRDCLQESLTNGKMIGICDQLYSIYLCEFFWKQIAPIANIILPKLVELAYGQGTRGGGEYLTVMGAWQNTQNSINYFTNTYAVNSLKAYQIRSVEEVGTPFCKAWISMKTPGSLESLIEPDSPPQFHAYFDTTKFSDATVPATAQYKVFYHIFAGKDSGVYYSVYLKNPPESSYYYTTQTVTVAYGFAPKGEYRSETRDFTAPEGYKELCVRINDEEKCGFKQVSTSAAINMLRDEYVGSQIDNQNIATEKECISGSASLGAIAANTNLQSMAQEAAMPSDYNRGVVRICSTANPGSGTEPLRYVPVGYCGDKKVVCWLDKKSVDKAITDNNVGKKNELYEELNKTMQAYLATTGEFFAYDVAKTELDSLENAAFTVEVSKSDEVKKIFDRIDFVYQRLALNPDKARLLLVKAALKHRIVDATCLPKIQGLKTTEQKKASGSTFLIMGQYQPYYEGSANPLVRTSSTDLYRLNIQTKPNQLEYWDIENKKWVVFSRDKKTEEEKKWIDNLEKGLEEYARTTKYNPTGSQTITPATPSTDLVFRVEGLSGDEKAIMLYSKYGEIYTGLSLKAGSTLIKYKDANVVATINSNFYLTNGNEYKITKKADSTVDLPQVTNNALDSINGATIKVLDSARIELKLASGVSSITSEKTTSPAAVSPAPVTPETPTESTPAKGECRVVFIKNFGTDEVEVKNFDSWDMFAVYSFKIIDCPNDNVVEVYFNPDFPDGFEHKYSKTNLANNIKVALTENNRFVIFEKRPEVKVGRFYVTVNKADYAGTPVENSFILKGDDGTNLQFEFIQ